MKVIAIEEAQYISSIKVYELIDSLLSFEMTISDKIEKKRKGVPVKAGVEEENKQELEDTDENISNSITLLEKKVW